MKDTADGLNGKIIFLELADGKHTHDDSEFGLEY